MFQMAWSSNILTFVYACSIYQIPTLCKRIHLKVEKMNKYIKIDMSESSHSEATVFYCVVKLAVLRGFVTW